MSDGLRTWTLATLGGWLVALGLVYLGERGLLPPPPVAAIPRLPDDGPPCAVATAPLAMAGAGAVDEASAPASAPEEPAAPGPARLVVADPVGVNLRAAPAMASAVIAVLPRGTLVEPGPADAPDDAVRAGWQHVVWKGRAGWVAERLLEPAAATP